MESTSTFLEDSVFMEGQTPPEDSISYVSPSIPNDIKEKIFKSTDGMRENSRIPDSQENQDVLKSSGKNKTSKEKKENSAIRDICAIKVSQLKKNPDGETADVVLTDFDKLPPGYVYRGGNVEFMFENKRLMENMLNTFRENKIDVNIPDKINSGSLLLADLIESKKSAKFAEKFQFDRTDIANDLRDIKSELTTAFVNFQRERYSALNEPGTNDEIASKRALESLVRRIPSIAGNHARLQVMLQGDDCERAFAGAALMEAWSTAMAQYRAEIDDDIKKLKPEQLEKIADEIRKRSDDKFHKASRDLQSMTSDYQNDLGFIFLGAFCPPLLFIAALPLIMPFLSSAMDRHKADTTRAKSMDQHRQIDERIEIATAITSSRKTVEDWIQHNIDGDLPLFLQELSDVNGEYLRDSNERFCQIKEVVTPLLKSNFEKKFLVGSPEEEMFRQECCKAAALVKEIKSPESKKTLNSQDVYINALNRIKESSEMEKDGLFHESSIAGSILKLVNTTAAKESERSSGSVLGESIFDSYIAPTTDGFGSGNINTGVDKGLNSTLTKDQMNLFMKSKIAADSSLVGKPIKNIKGDLLSQNKIDQDIVDLDMRLRCMVSYDTSLTRRDASYTKTGLDFLDAAFGFEHSKELSSQTFWGKLEQTPEFKTIERNTDAAAMDSIKRLVIATSMAESYKAQYSSIVDNHIENTYGAYLLLGYYQNAIQDIEAERDFLGDDNIKLFASASSKVASESAQDVKRYDKREYDAIKIEHQSLGAEYSLLKQKEPNVPAHEKEAYLKQLEDKKKELDAIEHESGIYMAKHLGVYQAAEITALTSERYVNTLLENGYDIENKSTFDAKAKEAFRSFIGGSDHKEFMAGGDTSPKLLKAFAGIMLAGNETSLNQSIEALSKDVIHVNQHQETWDPGEKEKNNNDNIYNDSDDDIGR